jgi:transposase
VRERAVGLVFEHQGTLDTQSAAIKSIAPKMGCGSDTLRAWVRRAKVNGTGKPLLTGMEVKRWNAKTGSSGGPTKS